MHIVLATGLLTRVGAARATLSTRELSQTELLQGSTYACPVRKPNTQLQVDATAHPELCESCKAS
jgi:hypothetical protein